MKHTELCQSIVGTSQKTNHGDTVKVLKYWVSTRGKDMLWIETASKKRLDVEAWYITDSLPKN